MSVGARGPAPLSALVIGVVVAGAALAWPRSARADAKGEAKLACSAAADRGQSQRDEGLYRAARASFGRCAQDDCPRIVARACGEWLRELDAATPTLVLGAKDARGADVADAHVEIDGAPLASALGGAPVSADPGVHRLRFIAKDGAVAEERVTLRAGEKNRLVVVSFPAAAPAPAAQTSLTSATPEDTVPSSSSGSPRVAVVITFTVLAVAATGVGVYFLADSVHEGSVADGLRAPLASSTACAASATNPGCAALSDTVDTQYRDARIAAVAFGAAGAFALGALATWLWWPSPASTDHTAAWSVTPAVAPTSAGLRFGRSF
jgi:hypothetical protein